MCVCACVCACVGACACVCACACVYFFGCVNVFFSMDESEVWRVEVFTDSQNLISISRQNELGANQALTDGCRRSLASEVNSNRMKEI